MSKNAKYPCQTLTEEDKELIHQISLKYTHKLYSLKEKYHNPKAFAKVILKGSSSRNSIAGVYTLAIAKNATPNQLFTPHEINQGISNMIQKNIQQDLKDMMLADESNLYLHPRELRKVTQNHEKIGVLFHIRTKNEIRELERGSRGPGKKPSSYEGNRNRGGKPSAYMLAEELDKLKNVIEKPGAVELLYEDIAKSGIAYELIKFLQLGLWHAAKMDETVLHKLMGFGASFVQDSLRKEDKDEFKTIHLRLLFSFTLAWHILHVKSSRFKTAMRHIRYSVVFLIFNFNNGVGRESRLTFL